MFCIIYNLNTIFEKITKLVGEIITIDFTFFLIFSVYNWRFK